MVEYIINLMLSLLYLILSFFTTIWLYRKYEKVGLYCWICVLVIVCNMQTIKLSELFGFTISLGNISYGALFLATDILSEKYGKEAAKDATMLSFIIMILFSLLMYIFLMYVPSEIDFTQEAFEIIFNYIPRVNVGSLLAYYISQRLDAYIYSVLKKKYDKVWISNNVSTIISQVVDTIIFVTIAFYGTMQLKEILTFMATMICFKWIIAILDTPFMLIAYKIKNNDKE